MSQDSKQNYKTAMISPGLLLFWMVGCGLGSAVGWVLAPTGLEKIGLGIGAVIGSLLVICWQLYKQRGEAENQTPVSLRTGGKIIYLFFISLSLWFAIYALQTWMDHPEKWLEALGGLLFAGVGIMVFALFWKNDSLGSFSNQVDVRGKKALGWCSFAMAAVSLILVPLGDPFLGIIGASFCVCCGVLLMKKGQTS